MASFPVLFGMPTFGSEDKDAWLRALTMFLGDPFRKIGGQYSFTVPGDAIVGPIAGASVWRNNGYGIRELNEFSESDTIADAGTMGLSNRPAVLFAYSATDNEIAIYLLAGTTYANSGAFLVYGNNTYWTTNTGTANRLSAYHDGSASFLFDNQLGHSVTLYMCIISLGEQITS